MRNGQWVKFMCKAPPEAHRAKDGKVVGIYANASTDPLNRSRVIPARIALVNSVGGNIRIEGKRLTVRPDEVTELEAVTSRDDIPEARIKDNPTWNPRA